MKNLYLIEYGCSSYAECLVVLAKDKQAAVDYAYQEAQDLYYSYDSNYPSDEDCEGLNEDEVAEMAREDMEQDIRYQVTEYNPENVSHVIIMRDQNNEPYEI